MAFIICVDEQDTRKVTEAVSAVIRLLKSQESMPKLIVTPKGGQHSLTAKVSSVDEPTLVAMLRAQGLRIITDVVEMVLEEPEEVEEPEEDDEDELEEDDEPEEDEEPEV